MKYCIGIDLGGTTVKFGVFTYDGVLIQKKEIPTRKECGRDVIFDDIAAAVRKIVQENSLDLNNCLIGMGIAGPVEDTGRVEVSVNLGMSAYYPGIELSRLLDNIPVYVLNDANAAALGEMWKGGGRGHKNMILITLGTGVGSGVIIDGSVIHGTHGLGGEIGHIWVNPDEPDLCQCGGRGCLDQIASATGIVKYADRFLSRSDRFSTICGIKDLSAKDVIDAAKSGDYLAMYTVNYCMEFLGKAIADITYVIDPEIILIGGGISKAGDFIREIIYDHYKNYPKIKKTLAPIELAQLGGDAGIYGAAFFARESSTSV